MSKREKINLHQYFVATYYIVMITLFLVVTFIH
ncbi:MAG: hypothetical protein JWN78_1036 [Bacteroidota bacterium]|nr:hypothetical protein [Bacteroidota bacterium]